MCFFQAPGLQGNQSLCQESQPSLVSLSAKFFFCGSFIWFFELELGNQMPSRRPAAALLLRGGLQLLLLSGNELRFL